MSKREPIDALGHDLRVRRRALDKTLSEVAHAADLSVQYLSDIETGRRLPPPVTIKRLAAVLDTDPLPLIWLWLLNHVGHDTADGLVQYASGGKRTRSTRETCPECGLDLLGSSYSCDCPGTTLETADHPYQRRASWSGDYWCAVEDCTIAPSSHPRRPPEGS